MSWTEAHIELLDLLINIWLQTAGNEMIVSPQTEAPTQESSSL